MGPYGEGSGAIWGRQWGHMGKAVGHIGKAVGPYREGSGAI